MNTLWTFGCSFTAEWFPVGMDGFKSAYDDYKNWRGGNLPDVWPTLLAKKLNYKCCNCAVGGNSNYGIMTQFYDVCENIKENDIMIFGWTSITRFILANFKEEVMNHVLVCETDYSGTFISNKSIEEIFYNRSNPLWVTEVHKWIHMINTFAKLKNVKVFHWTSDDSIFDLNSKYSSDDRFIIQKNSNYPTYDILGYLQLPIHYKCNDFIANIRHETKGEVFDGHMGEYGHKLQAEYFYDFIQNNSPETKNYSI